MLFRSVSQSRYPAILIRIAGFNKYFCRECEFYFHFTFWLFQFFQCFHCTAPGIHGHFRIDILRFQALHDMCAIYRIRSIFRQNVTLTFTSSTAFTILGDTLGSLGSGNISGVNCAPNNPSVGAPYWTINASGFGGTFQAGDTITFTVTPSAKGIWLKRVIPVNTPSMAGNRFVLVVEGESE